MGSRAGNYDPYRRSVTKYKQYLSDNKSSLTDVTT